MSYTSEAGGSLPISTSQQKRAVIVDNSSNDCEQLALLLEVLGWNIDTVSSISILPLEPEQLLFVSANLVTSEAELSMLAQRNVNDALILFGAADALLGVQKKWPDRVFTLALPIDIVIAERLIENFS